MKMMNTKISKKVSVKQHDQSDCGAAWLQCWHIMDV